MEAFEPFIIQKKPTKVQNVFESVKVSVKLKVNCNPNNIDKH